MSNRRKSKAEMKQVYLIRRVVAILLLILILVTIFTMCGRDEDPINSNQTQDVPVTTDPEFDNTTNNQVIVPSEDTNLDNEVDTEADPSGELNSTLMNNEVSLQEEYGEYADVSYDEENDAFNFILKDEYRDLILNQEEASDIESEEVDADFWENFKTDLITTSETLSENVQPGISLHVLDPADDSTTILLIQDGSELYDLTN